MATMQFTDTTTGATRTVDTREEVISEVLADWFPDAPAEITDALKTLDARGDGWHDALSFLGIEETVR